MTDSTEAKPTIKLDCPKCSKTNTYRPSLGIKCSGCEEHLTGYRYQKYKHFFGGLLLVASTGFLGFKSAEIFDDDKVALFTHYTLMDMCVNGEFATLPRNVWSRKVDVCACMLGISADKIGEMKTTTEVIAKLMIQMKRALPQCTG
jgi:hypothetical protein|tara:strand:- start:1077 stop:1514 length:438 start_codon:yes stop_codon:yes gene_type:complete